eukprot:m.43036 g.43036  ORF g.43036 m.43036 type:complete len:161 (-) comp11609_c0_seq1:686-1168(-)
MCSAYRFAGVAAAALEQYDDAVQYAESALGLGNDDLVSRAQLNQDIGAYCNGTGDFAGSIAYHQRASALHSETGNVINEAIVCGNLGYALANIGKYEEAQRHLEHALGIFSDHHEQQLEVCLGCLVLIWLPWIGLGSVLCRLSHVYVTHAFTPPNTHDSH